MKRQITNYWQFHFNGRVFEIETYYDFRPSAELDNSSNEFTTDRFYIQSAWRLFADEQDTLLFEVNGEQTRYDFDQPLTLPEAEATLDSTFSSIDIGFAGRYIDQEDDVG